MNYKPSIESCKNMVMNCVATCIMYNKSGHWSDEMFKKDIAEAFEKFTNLISIDPWALSSQDLKALGFCKWNNNLFLIPIYLWNCIPDGTELYCIDDTWRIKGVNTEGRPDTRFGMTAYGVNVVDYDNYD